MPGLGSSAFARHYSRNHGCFLLLRVLRWFTSPGSLRATMNSSRDTWCSHQAGSPIRISPDHRLCASPRGFSQLTTSFFAFLRLGIPTHALSSLTIKSISDTEHSRSPHPIATLTPSGFSRRPRPSVGELMYAHLVFGCQRSKLLTAPLRSRLCTATTLQTRWWAWVDSNYRPHPYQGCALTT